MHDHVFSIDYLANLSVTNLFIIFNEYFL